jgi:hypothetical protein
MRLGNMRVLGVQRLVASYLNDACRHQGLIDVSNYPADTEVRSFASKVACAKCFRLSGQTKFGFPLVLLPPSLREFIGIVAY